MTAPAAIDTTAATKVASKSGPATRCCSPLPARRIRMKPV